MVPVLNAPVRADGAGVETDLTGVAADLLTRRPQTGCPSRRSGAKPGRRRRSAAATRGPAGVEDLDQSMLLATPPVAVEGVVLGAEPGQCLMQGGLVLLHLDQQAISAARVKLSFWQCRASAVNSTPLTPNSVISVGTAGTSPGAPATSWWARMRAASLAKALST